MLLSVSKVMCCRDCCPSSEYRRGISEEKERPDVAHDQCFLPTGRDAENTTPPSAPITIKTLNSTSGVEAQDISASTLDLPSSISSGSSSDTLRNSRTHCCAPHITTRPCCPPAKSSKLGGMPCSKPHPHSQGESHDTVRRSGRGFHSSHSWLSRTGCSTPTSLDEYGLKETDEQTEDLGDIERGPPNFERVILTIEGLKCGCCENGISRAVSHVPAITNHRVNVVLAKVEFDLDINRLSVREVIKKLSATTGYAFEEYIQPEGQVLELLVNDPTVIYRAGRPHGVTILDSESKSVWTHLRIFSGRNSAVPPEASEPSLKGARTDDVNPNTTANSFYQHTVRIHYDPKKAGARDVFEYYQQSTLREFQLAPPASHPSLTVGSKQTKRACIVFLITLAFTTPVLVFAWAPVDHKELIYAHVSLALASAVQIIATWEFVPGALRALIHSRLFEMDFLIALSTTTAYVFSVVSYVFQLKKHPFESGSFFETSTLLVTLILLGRVVSEFARLRAAKSVSFRSLQVDDALLMEGKTFSEPVKTRKIDARLLQYGDYFKVPPHTKIVTDGKVKYGGSTVDESMITGESLPVAKGIDSNVYAGTNNGGGTLIAALTALPHENSVSKIATMVESAELTKPKAQALADRIAGWFVPAMAAIGTVVFLTWLFVDRYHHRRSWPKAAIKAFTYAIATLIVSCPCAIGLAVPMVVLIAGGVSARFSIIFRDPQKIEIARNVTDIVFDKTGTLTAGLLKVEEVDFYDASPVLVKAMLLGLLKDVKHPVAAAVFNWIHEEAIYHSSPQIQPMDITDISSIPGDGVRGICKESKLEVRAGNPRWVGVSMLESEHSLLCVTVSDILCATFRLKDRVRCTAKLTVERLQARGIQAHMISGDSPGAVKDIAHSLNIPKDNTGSNVTPGGKRKYVQGLQDKGKIVMFVGDGTNDSVALKQSDIGVHLNHGSDVAKSAADVVLMTEHLHNILILLDISGAAYRRIVLNFCWSALYNIVAILMAAGAFVKVRIEPQYAGLGELVSVLPVVLIAFQMRWRSYGREYRKKEWDNVEVVDTTQG